MPCGNALQQMMRKGLRLGGYDHVVYRNRVVQENKMWDPNIVVAKAESHLVEFTKASSRVEVGELRIERGSPRLKWKAPEAAISSVGSEGGDLFARRLLCLTRALMFAGEIGFFDVEIDIEDARQFSMGPSN
uniref:Uncharacterized protein n=1 Tax=Fagus sylvatica TaxID=28930 RepID=A0A2N9FK41_FAGSY